MEENKPVGKTTGFYIRDTHEKLIVKALIKFIRAGEEGKKELMRLFGLTK